GDWLWNWITFRFWAGSDACLFAIGRAADGTTQAKAKERETAGSLMVTPYSHAARIANSAYPASECRSGNSSRSWSATEYRPSRVRRAGRLRRMTGAHAYQPPS